MIRHQLSPPQVGSIIKLFEKLRTGWRRDRWSVRWWYPVIKIFESLSCIKLLSNLSKTVIYTNRPQNNRTIATTLLILYLKTKNCELFCETASFKQYNSHTSVRVWWWSTVSKGTKGRNRRGFSRGGRWAMGKVTGRGWEKTEKPAFSAIVVEPVICI